MKIKKDDTVKVMAGKDQGKTGKVHRAIPKENKVVVSGINIIKRHIRARPGLRQAGRVESEAPMSVAKVALLCPKCERPTRVGYQLLEGGGKVRICRKCGQAID